MIRRSVSTCSGNDCTGVSVALVSVDGQVRQVRVGVLVWRSGHYKMHQAFSFPDGGDGFSVRHACHEVLIHLQERRD